MSTMPSTSSETGGDAACNVNSIAEMTSKRWDSSEEAYNKLEDLEKQAGHTIIVRRWVRDKYGKPRNFEIVCKNRTSDKSTCSLRVMLSRRINTVDWVMRVAKEHNCQPQRLDNAHQRLLVDQNSATRTSSYPPLNSNSEAIAGASELLDKTCTDSEDISRLSIHYILNSDRGGHANPNYNTLSSQPITSGGSNVTLPSINTLLDLAQSSSH